MLGSILELVLETGAIGPLVLAVAFVMWQFGIRDPFLLAFTSLLIGGVLGFGLNRVLASILMNRRMSGKRRAE